MTASSTLVKDLQAQLKRIEADLLQRSDDPSVDWAKELRAEWDDAMAHKRTALTWTEWRKGELAQAAVAWVLGATFIRFCEDNQLLDGVWLAGAGDRFQLAVDSEAAYYQAHPEKNARDWLLEAFNTLSALPAGRGLLDPRHNPVWRITPSADAIQAHLTFWRTRQTDGSLVHDLTDPELDTRFLGDIYQDLSDFAKKKYALLQTPEFVEEFILDRTLTPALSEFGLEGLRLIDPTCGSGHFLLGAFTRLLDAWAAQAPNVGLRVRVENALDSIHGVDINPFAVAIARFRLTVAALKASGFTNLKDAPAFKYHIAIGDSLISGPAGRQGKLDFEDEDSPFSFRYFNEDVDEHPNILDPGRYHIVVGNPPYITVKDSALNDLYRQRYATCHRQYALSVPFMELFFKLAIRADATRPAGYIGQITSNSFMKREFGSKLIGNLLSGLDQTIPVDLTTVIDTSGAYIPGHGTPTVIIIGRKRIWSAGTLVRAVLGVRGEPGLPKDPAKGLVWSEITEHIDETYNGLYITVMQLDRGSLSTHPWSLSGGGASELRSRLDAQSVPLGGTVESIGYTGQTNADEAFLALASAFERHGVERSAHRQVVVGEVVRDYQIDNSDHSVFLYGSDGLLDIDAYPGAYRWLWPRKFVTWSRVTFAKNSYREEGRTWWEWHQAAVDRLKNPLSIAFAFVATHNHFVLDRGGKVFNRSAPVIKLPVGASEGDHLELLGVLNSSTACFWLKQVSHNKGNGGIGGGIGDEDWEPRYEFTGTKLQEFPLPSALPLNLGRDLDRLAQQLRETSPENTLAQKCTSKGLTDSRAASITTKARMIAVQEELDWEVYGLYGLIDEALTYPGEDLPGLALGERAFEVVLARGVQSGAEETAWFERHESMPITELPSDWPSGYRDLVQRRLDFIASDPNIRLLERPEYKRRWAGPSWEDQEKDALRGYVLDRLEADGLWSDEQGPRTLSVARLADLVRGDDDLVTALGLLAGHPDVDVSAELGRLVSGEHVPFLAAYRYTDAGLDVRAEWERVWDLQRAEDRGEKVEIQVPPRYGKPHFRKDSFWKQRGKLDVPKERFISYPDAGRPGDVSLVLGWAGWDYAAQARALARLILERQQQDGWGREPLIPLLAGLVELEPWLKQWHGETDPELGSSPAEAIEALLDQQLDRFAMTRTDLRRFRATAPTRRRKKASAGAAHIVAETLEVEV